MKMLQASLHKSFRDFSFIVLWIQYHALIFHPSLPMFYKERRRQHADCLVYGSQFCPAPRRLTFCTHAVHSLRVGIGRKRPDKVSRCAARGQGRLPLFLSLAHAFASITLVGVALAVNARELTVNPACCPGAICPLISPIRCLFLAQIPAASKLLSTPASLAPLAKCCDRGCPTMGPRSGLRMSGPQQ